MLKRFIFCLKSQGKFRLHSPFVYDFYEDVLENITHKNYRDKFEDKLKLFLLSKNNIVGNDVKYVIMYDIHQDKDKGRKWRNLIEEESSALTVDCYYFGIVFNIERKEKQHFMLRW